MMPPPILRPVTGAIIRTLPCSGRCRPVPGAPVSRTGTSATPTRPNSSPWRGASALRTPRTSAAGCEIPLAAWSGHVPQKPHEMFLGSGIPCHSFSSSSAYTSAAANSRPSHPQCSIIPRLVLGDNHSPLRRLFGVVLRRPSDHDPQLSVCSGSASVASSAIDAPFRALLIAKVGASSARALATAAPVSLASASSSPRSGLLRTSAGRSS